MEWLREYPPGAKHHVEFPDLPTFLAARSDNFIAEEKMDGTRFLMWIDKQGHAQFTTRHESAKTGLPVNRTESVPHLQPHRSRIGSTVLDGEVLIPGVPFRASNGVMNCAPAEAIARQEKLGKFVFHVFDMPWYGGRDLRIQPFSLRRELMVKAVAELNNEHIVSMQQLPGVDAADLYQRTIERSGEGIIIKDRYGAWDGKTWWKVKRFGTVSVFIIGFTEAKDGKTAKYRGLIGAIRLGVWKHEFSLAESKAMLSARDIEDLITRGHIVEVGQTSGMDDALRREISANRVGWTGRVIDVCAQDRDKNKLRHPRWDQERPDINANKCTLAKLDNDLKRCRKPGEEC